MLDTETKRRIDTARDILVGKVPDPKSQVEQITIALIYKFMDDMDKEAVDFGGVATFFSGEYAKYSWTKIFDPKVGGHEMLNLYGEAILKLNQNPSIPQLFRDIFKNAYLPYRDPETLKLFLKTINEFHYDHSEKLGDAFEYLLSVLGSQGDAGQFRTPRHIIDFMVEVLQPQKNETICDPACGTAGFLISSYKYILAQNTKKNKGDLLTSDDRKKLLKNFTGYDISPDMVRLSLVNMFLHGFKSPRIYEYDTLTSEDRWNEYFDVIIANPPFMSPKGGIKPHKKFTIQANRSEVLFLDYIAEHIHPSTGRAGVIVPEGIIFQSANAYKQLRKMLVEKYLYAVVSLPAGIFQPYSGVKTSILLMDRTLAKKTDDILFVKIDNDGFDLGAQRRAIDKNDLTGALQIMQDYKKCLNNDLPDYSDFDDYLNKQNHSNLLIKNPDFYRDKVQTVSKEKIAEKGDYNLSVDRYRVNENVRQSEFEMVKLGDVCDVRDGTLDSPKYQIEGFPLITSKNIKDGYIDFSEVNLISKEDLDKINKRSKVDDGDIIMPMIGTIGNPIIVKKDREFAIKNVALIKLKNESTIQRLYLKSILASAHFNEHFLNQSSGSTQKFISLGFVRDLQIPLPPLSIQQQIVSKIESYQAIINGAKQVVENYKPQIDIDPDWEMVELRNICEGITKGTTPTSNGFKFEEKGIHFIKIQNINDDGLIVKDSIHFISTECHQNLKRSQLKENDILFSIAGTDMGITGIVDESVLPSNTNQALAILRVVDNSVVAYKYLFHVLRSNLIQDEIEKIKTGVAQFNLSLQQVSDLEIPLPPLFIQQQIVTRIEQEQQLVNANKELIKIFEQKIKDEINKLWKKEVKEYAIGEEVVGMVAEE